MLYPSDPPDRHAHDVDEATRIYLLPNLLTAANLFFGFLAAIRCIQANVISSPEEAGAFYTEAIFFLLFAVICDGLDGRVARLGGKESLFGAEFDSLADIVSFGIVPSLMVYFLILSPTETFPFFRQIGWLIGFLYLVSAAVRLARFNVLAHPLLPRQEKDRRTRDFMGLPVPAAAGTIGSVVLVMVEYELPDWVRLLLPVLMILIAYLMISQVPYPSFKQIDWNTRLRLRWFILGLAIIGFLFMLRELGLLMIFMAYIFYGLGRSILLSRLSQGSRKRPPRDGLKEEEATGGTTRE